MFQILTQAEFFCVLTLKARSQSPYGCAFETGLLSKTKAMNFPPPRVQYSAADTSRIDVLNESGVPIGFIDFYGVQVLGFYRALFFQFRRGC